MQDNFRQFSIKVQDSASSGRDTVIVTATDVGMQDLISKNGRTIIINIKDSTSDVMNETVLNIINELDIAKARLASVIGIGDGAPYALMLSLENPKLIRSLSLIDPVCRSFPSGFTKLVDLIESKLPMGLPLRRNYKDFDVRSFLHRIRRPTLIIKSDTASNFVSQQIDIIAKLIPTSVVNTIKDLSTVSLLIEQFQAVPIKCPQN